MDLNHFNQSFFYEIPTNEIILKHIEKVGKKEKKRERRFLQERLNLY